jgi:hypothetical protein
VTDARPDKEPAPRTSSAPGDGPPRTSPAVPRLLRTRSASHAGRGRCGYCFARRGARSFGRSRCLSTEARVSANAPRACAPDERRACRLALAARLLLWKAITPAPTGRVTAWATKQSRAPEPVDYPSQRTAIAPAHCARRSFGRRARLHLETAAPRPTKGAAPTRLLLFHKSRTLGPRPPRCARGQHRATSGLAEIAPHRRHKPREGSAWRRGLQTESNPPSPLRRQAALSPELPGLGRSLLV